MAFYKINPESNYLKTLAEFIFSQNNYDFLNLSNNLIILPTKRACLFLKKSFAEISQNKAVIMPEIISIGEFDEDELNLKNITNNNIITEFKKVISKERKELLIAKLIRENKALRIFDNDINFEQSLKLARSLAELLDNFKRCEIDTSELINILPEELSIHKQKSLTFLNSFFDSYPKILEELNLCDAIDRRNALIESYIKNLKNSSYRNIYIAGTTGTIKSTRSLIKAITSLKNGHFILPYIETNLNEEDYKNLLTDKNFTNHQYHIAELLDYLAVKPHEIEEISDNFQYNNFVNILMYPPSKIFRWNNINKKNFDKKINVVSAESQIEEAKLITLIIREKLAENKSISVITNSTEIAGFLGIYLKNYGIFADASFGKTLNTTIEGKYILQLAEAIGNNFKISSLLDILKNNLSKTSDFSKDLKILENKIIRKNNISNLEKLALDLTKEEKLLSDEFLFFLQEFLEIQKSLSNLFNIEIITAINFLEKFFV